MPNAKPLANSNPVALITGASAGIGAEFAKIFASHGYDLILVARRKEKLNELAQSLQDPRKQGACQVHCISLDLCKVKGPSKLYNEVASLGLSVDVLVNNAGSAFQGSFADMPSQKIRDMTSLNVRALSEITHQFLPQMLKRGSGKILNVASVVGFQAIAGMSLYSATKAFVLSFSESLSEELRGTGVSVCALCPGLTNTEMVGDLGTDKIPGAHLLMADAYTVALEGYNALNCQQVVRIPGMLNRAVINWAEYQPRWLKRALTGVAGRAMLSQRRSS